MMSFFSKKPAPPAGSMDLEDPKYACVRKTPGATPSLERISATEPAKTRHGLPCVCVLSHTPFRKDTRWAYFEVTIVNPGARGAIAIGLSGLQTYARDAMPGWEPGSIALHGDDGKLFSGTSAGRQVTDAFSAAGTVIGAGVDMKKGTAFFTVNGKVIVGNLSVPWAVSQPVYAAVGMLSVGEKVSVNFNRPFRYDLDKLIHATGGDVAPSSPHAAAAAASELESLRFEIPKPSAAPRVRVLSPLSFEYLRPAAEGAATSALLTSKPLPSNTEWIGAATPTAVAFFEVTIENPGEHGYVAVGFTSNPDYDRAAQPGWHAESIGLHADDGKVYFGDGAGLAPTTAPFPRRGVIVGAAFFIASGDVVFTVDGAVVAKANVRTKWRRHDVVFGIVGLHSQGEVIRANFRGPFRTAAPTVFAAAGIALPAAAPSTGAAAEPSGIRFEAPTLAAMDCVRVLSPLSFQFKLPSVATYPLPCGTLLSSAPLTPNAAWLGTAGATSQRVLYFETTIEKPGEHAYIAVGFTCDPRYDRRAQPGWHANSVALHADDGKLYAASGAGMELTAPFGRTGAVIGAALFLDSYTVAFTVDGALVTVAQVRGALTDGVPVYAAVGLHSSGETVRANFAGPFRTSAAVLLAAMGRASGAPPPKASAASGEDAATVASLRSRLAAVEAELRVNSEKHAQELAPITAKLVESEQRVRVEQEKRTLLEQEAKAAREEAKAAREEAKVARAEAKAAREEAALLRTQLAARTASEPCGVAGNPTVSDSAVPANPGVTPGAASAASASALPDASVPFWMQEYMATGGSVGAAPPSLDPVDIDQPTTL